MTVYYRLYQDHKGVPEGAVISESQFKGLYFLNRPLYEQIGDWEIEYLIRHDDESYCKSIGVLFFLFYTEEELNEFLNKKYECRIIY